MAILIPFSEGEQDADAHLQRMGSRLPLKGDQLPILRVDPIQSTASQEALSERCHIYPGKLIVQPVGWIYALQVVRFIQFTYRVLLHPIKVNLWAWRAV
jgi:hypothetical protein